MQKNENKTKIQNLCSIQSKLEYVGYCCATQFYTQFILVSRKCTSDKIIILNALRTISKDQKRSL